MLDGRWRDNALWPGAVGAAAWLRGAALYAALNKECPYIAQDCLVVNAGLGFLIPSRTAMKLTHPAMAQAHGGSNLSPRLARVAYGDDLLS